MAEGVCTILPFVAVNGVAIGRDLGEMVTARHGDRASRHAWLRATRGKRALMGLIVTGVFLVPIVDLLAPLLGAAMARHLFHETSQYQ
jgi:CysZ protein